MIVKHYIVGRMKLVQENTLLYADATTGLILIVVKLTLGELKIFQLENVRLMEEVMGINTYH
jgi:hypothetical protein